MKRIGLIWVVLVSLLCSCTSYPRVLNSTVDTGGRSLNSFASELTPQVTDQYVVFVSDRNDSQDIYLYSLQNRRLIDLPGLNALNEIASHPSISEDGRYVVFASSSAGKTAIYIYDRETQQKRNLALNLAAEVRNPSISADGSTIAFEVGRDGQWDIWIGDRFGKRLDATTAAKL